MDVPESAQREAFRLINAWVAQRLSPSRLPHTPIDHQTVVQGLGFMSQCLVKLADQWASRTGHGQGDPAPVDKDMDGKALVGAVALLCMSITGLAKVLAADLVSGGDTAPQATPVVLVDTVVEPIVRLTSTCLSPTLHPADHTIANHILARTLPTLDTLLILLLNATKLRIQPSHHDQLDVALANLFVQLPPLTIASPLPQPATAHFWSTLWPTFTSFLCSRFAVDPLFLRDLVSSALLPTLRPSISYDMDPRLAYPPAFWHSLSLLLPFAFPNLSSTDWTRGHPHLPDPDSELGHRSNVYLDLLDHLSVLADHPRSAFLVPSASMVSLLTCLTHLLHQDSLMEMLVVNDAYGIATVRAATLVVTRHVTWIVSTDNCNYAGEWQAFVGMVKPLMASSIPRLATVPHVMELAGLAGAEGDLGGGKVVMGKWAWLVAQLLHLDQAADAMVDWMMNGSQSHDEDDSEDTIQVEPDGLVIVEDLLEVVDLLAHDLFGCPCCQRQATVTGADETGAGRHWVWDQTIAALVAPITVLDAGSAGTLERLVERWIRSLVRHLVKCRHTSTAQIILACFAVMLEAMDQQQRPPIVSQWIQSVVMAVKDGKAGLVVVQRLEALARVVGTWGVVGAEVL